MTFEKASLGRKKLPTNSRLLNVFRCMMIVQNIVLFPSKGAKKASASSSLIRPCEVASVSACLRQQRSLFFKTSGV